MSLYQMQKFLFDINRDRGVQQQYRDDLDGLLDRYELTAEERGAIATGDIGLIYVLGANGQLLMHYAAFLGMPWAEYIAAMRRGVSRYGPVRAGLYAHDDGDGREGGRRMSLVFAGIASHAPGITGRAHLADPTVARDFHGAYRALGRAARGRSSRRVDRDSGGALRQFLHEQHAVVRRGHGGTLRGPDRGSRMAGYRPHQGSRQRGALPAAHPRDDADRRSRVRGRVEIRSRHHGAAAFPDAALRSARRSDEHQLPGTAVWRRCIALGRFGEALRRAADSVPERIAVIGTGGISHWPATPDSGKINEAWDREFLERWQANDRQALVSYSDEATYRDAGQGGFEIRTFIAVAAAAQGRGTLQSLPADSHLRGRMHHRRHEHRSLNHVAHDARIQRESAHRRPLRRSVPRSSRGSWWICASRASRYFRRAACGCAPFPATIIASPTAASRMPDSCTPS